MASRLNPGGIMFRLTCLALALSMMACGGDDDGTGGGDGAGGADGGGVIDGTGRYLPLEVDNQWTYQVVKDTGEQFTKSSHVEVFEAIGGNKGDLEAFRVRTDKDTGYTLSWQEDTGDMIIRHREQSFGSGDVQETDEYYVPSKMRIDESEAHLADGATYSYTYDEQVYDVQADTNMTTSKTENWEVRGVGEEVTVPAGTFACLHLYRSNDGTGSMKEYWFSRGVGKVKETGGGQTELLADYTVN
jgi:hypothetical protein